MHIGVNAVAQRDWRISGVLGHTFNPLPSTVGWGSGIATAAVWFARIWSLAWEPRMLWGSQKRKNIDICACLWKWIIPWDKKWECLFLTFNFCQKFWAYNIQSQRIPPSHGDFLLQRYLFINLKAIKYSHEVFSWDSEVICRLGWLLFTPLSLHF